MAQGLAVALPLRIDEIDGAYETHKDLISMAEQNLKMLILTSKGERCMSPNFGVGIRRYLFEQNAPGVIDGIKADILAQVARYLPYISITDLQVYSPALATDPGSTDNTRINISITYIIPAASIGSNLTIPIAA
jgi:phage baseplate assembly protein W